MNKRRLALITGSALTVALLATSALLPGAASARQDPSPTPAPLGDFIIPTSTPLAEQPVQPIAPTPTTGGGGLFIPTSTPSAPAGPTLPILSEQDLIGLNIRPDDVPAEFAANQVAQTFDTAQLAGALSDGGYTDLVDITQRLADFYGWTSSQGVSYTNCQPNLPVNRIRSEVAQLASPEAARAFVDDADAQILFQGLGYTVDFAEQVHGWQMTLAEEGVCFAQEVEYSLMLEYWGLLISIGITADANTDPALIWGLIDQLAQLLVARTDALAPTRFPPTPTPGAAVAAATALVVPVEATEAVMIEPTQEVFTPAPTEPPAPTEGAIGEATPFALQATETYAPADPAETLAELEALMPTLQEIGLPSPPFDQNEELSGSFTFDEVIALAQATGVPALADAIEAAGSRDGLLGQVMRVWDTGDACPATPALSLEVDLILFGTVEGAAANLVDAASEQAWLDTGVFQSFEQRPDGSVLGTGSVAHPCGQLAIYALSTQVGRVNIAVSATATQAASEGDILSALDVLTEYMADKIGAFDLD